MLQPSNLTDGSSMSITASLAARPRVALITYRAFYVIPWLMIYRRQTGNSAFSTSHVYHQAYILSTSRPVDLASDLSYLTIQLVPRYWQALTIDHFGNVCHLRAYTVATVQSTSAIVPAHLRVLFYLLVTAACAVRGDSRRWSCPRPLSHITATLGLRPLAGVHALRRSTGAL
jgi:hypothetical protein